MLPMFRSVRFSRVFEWPELDPGQCFLDFTEPEPEPLLTLVQVKKRFRSGSTPGRPRANPEGRVREVLTLALWGPGQGDESWP